MEKKSLDCAVMAPKMELSDKLKQIIRRISSIEEVLNETLFNTCLRRFETSEFRESECHTESVDQIDERLMNLERVVEALNLELR